LLNCLLSQISRRGGPPDLPPIERQNDLKKSAFSSTTPSASRAYCGVALTISNFSPTSRDDYQCLTTLSFAASGATRRRGD
jgi:hypothetical protein